MYKLLNKKNSVAPYIETGQRDYKKLWQESIRKIIESQRQEKTQKPALLRYSSTKANFFRIMDQLNVDSERPILPFMILDPNSVEKGVWDLVIGIVMLYVAIVTPLTLSFIETQLYDGWFWVDISIDLIFVFDVICNLNTSFYDSEGNLRVSRKEIFLNYLKGWLIMDVFTCVPFEVLQIIFGGYSATNKLARMAKLRILPRLFRVVRLIKMVKHVKKSRFVTEVQSIFSLNYRIMKVLTICGATLICIHVVACFWYFVAKYNEFNEETWVSRFRIQDASAGYSYLCSVYWVLTTLTSVGYGDITPRTVEEKGVAMVWMAFSLYFVSFTVSSISALISQINEKNKFIESLLGKVDFFAEELEITKDLREKVQNYIRKSANNYSVGVNDKFDLIALFPNDIKLSIVHDIHHGIYKNFEIFSKQSTEFLIKIIPLMDTREYLASVSVYSVGEISNEIYFILKGKIHYKHNDSIFRLENPGSYFGDYEVFKGVAREYSVFTVVNSYIWVMTKQLIKIITQEFPIIFNEFKQASNINYKKIKASLAEIECLKEYKGRTHTEIRRSINERYQQMLNSNINMNYEIKASGLRLESDLEEAVETVKDQDRALDELIKKLTSRLASTELRVIMSGQYRLCEIPKQKIRI